MSETKNKPVKVRVTEFHPDLPQAGQDLIRRRAVNLPGKQGELFATVKLLDGSVLGVDADGVNLTNSSGDELVPLTDFSGKRIVIKSGERVVEIKRN